MSSAGRFVNGAGPSVSRGRTAAAPGEPAITAKKTSKSTGPSNNKPPTKPSSRSASRDSVPIVDRSSFPSPGEEIFPKVSSALRSAALQQPPGPLNKPDNEEIRSAEAELAQFEAERDAREFAELSRPLPGISQELFEREILPLRRENLKLIKTNNSLNQHLIKESEAAEDKDSRYVKQIRLLKSQNSDLTFLASQKQRKLRLQEEEMNELRKRMEKILQEKQFFVREALEATSAIPQTGQSILNRAVGGIQASQAEINAVRAAEEKIAQLQQELRSAQATIDEQNVFVSSSESKIFLRDQEIERLAKILENDRNWDKLNAETAIDIRQEEIQKLNQQLDYLNSQLQSQNAFFAQNGHNQQEFLEQLEKKDKEIQYLLEKSKKSLLESMNSQESLQEIQGKMRKQQEDFQHRELQWNEILQEKNHQYDYIHQKFQQSLIELEQKAIELSTMKQQELLWKAKIPSRPLEALEEELSKQTGNLEILKEKYSLSVKESEERAISLQQSQEELKALKSSSGQEIHELKAEILRQQGKYEELFHRYQSQQEENLSYQKSNETMKYSYQDLENHQSLLKQEIHYYKELYSSLGNSQKNQLESLEEKIQENAHLHGQINRFTVEKRQWEEEKIQFLQEIRQWEFSENQWKMEKSQWADEKQKMENTMKFLRSLSEEQMNSLSGLNELSTEKSNLLRQLDRQKLTISTLTGDKEELFNKYQLLQGEKQSLLSTLADIEKQLLNIQREVRVLTEERDSTRILYQQLNEELKNAEKSERAQKDKIQAMQGEIALLSKEKEELRLAIQSHNYQTSFKSDSLQSKMEEIQGLKAERQRLTGDLEDAESRINQMRLELQTFQLAVKEKESLLGRADSDHKEFQLQFANTVTENAQLKGTLEELKTLVRRLEKSKDAFQYELGELNQQLIFNKKEMQRLSNEKSTLQAELAVARQEGEHVKGAITEFDEARQRLQDENHALHLELDKLKTGRTIHQQASDQLAMLVDQHQSRLASAEAELASKDRKLSEFLGREREFHEMSVRLEEEARLKNIEIKGLLDDLHNLLKENQAVTKELQSAKNARDIKTEECERLIAQADHLQQVNGMKEREVNELLTNYRSVCLENERLKASGIEFENERIATRQQSRANQEALTRLEIAIQSLEQEKARRLIDLQAYERQLEEMNRQLEMARDQTHQWRMNAERLQGEVAAARNVSAGMEQNRVEFGRKEIELKQHSQRLNAEIIAYKGDLQTLQSAIKVQRERSEQLENTLNQMRIANQKETARMQQQMEERIKTITELNLTLAQSRNHAELLQEQVNAIASQRDRQSAEILRLTNSLAQQASEAQGSSAANDALLQQLAAYQSTIRELNELIESSGREKLKLRNFLFKYESEVQKLENQIKPTQSTQSPIRPDPLAFERRFASPFRSPAPPASSSEDSKSHQSPPSSHPSIPSPESPLSAGYSS